MVSDCRAKVGRAEIGHPPAHKGKGGRGRVVVGAHHEYPAARSTSSCADSRSVPSRSATRSQSLEGETRFMPFVRPRKDWRAKWCQHRQRLTAVRTVFEPPRVKMPIFSPISDCSAVRNTPAIRSRGELQGWRVMRHPKRKMTHPDLRMWALVTGVAEALKRRARAYRATQRDIPRALSEARALPDRRRRALRGARTPPRDLSSSG